MQRHIQLTTPNIKRTHNGFAIYSLKYEPLAQIYLGSTALLRDKLYWWHHVISRRDTAATLPWRIADILKDRGNLPEAWSFSVLDTDRPERFNAKARGAERPEWPLVARLHATSPHLLLNNAAAVLRPRRAPPLTTRGPQPLTYLAIRLGLRKGPDYQAMPPHSWAIDPTDLGGSGSPMVPFALYLHRSAKAERSINPSPEAIAALYRKWLAHVPVSEREAAGTITPRSIDEALAVPVPRGYDHDLT
jgi:hypothetical protein